MKAKISATQITWLVIAVIVLIIVLVIVFRKKGPPPNTEISAQKSDDLKNNLQNAGDPTNPLTDDQLSSFVTILGDEYQNWMVKYTPVIADVGPFDTVIRQLTSKAQFNQLNSAYVAKYNIALLDDVQHAMTFNKGLLGVRTMEDASASTYNADLDFLKSLPQN